MVMTFMTSLAVLATMILTTCMGGCTRPLPPTIWRQAWAVTTRLTWPRTWWRTRKMPTGPHLSVAAIVKVTNGVGIVAERPMYFNVLGVRSGTDVVGATVPQLSYYFSEADQTQSGSANYHTFLTMLNPSPTVTAHVTITYYTVSCGATAQQACPTEAITLLPLTRQTPSPSDVGLQQKLAISVRSSDNPIVVERPMYFTDNVPNSGLTTGAASEVGATQPGTNWLFAEGYTGSGFQEYYELANF